MSPWFGFLQRQKNARLCTIYQRTCGRDDWNPSEKAFKDDWFNKEYNLNITEADLIELLEVSTKNQLSQFQRVLHEQVDGVAMGSPLGPLMANAFMCNIEEQLTNQNKMPTFYKRYVDDTLNIMPDVQAASTFLSTLNEIHPSISFTMELEKNGKLPFLGMEITRNKTRLDRKVYRKPTDTGLLLHCYSHVDMKYKQTLLKTIMKRAFKLSSNLKEIFTCLHYPEPLIQNTIRFFVEMKATGSTSPPQQASEIPVRIPLPFKDQRSANKLREQLSDLS